MSVTGVERTECIGEVADFGIPVFDLARDEFSLEHPRVRDHGVSTRSWCIKWKRVIFESSGYLPPTE